METKRFGLRTLLTVTTGRLLTEPEGERDNGIGKLHKLLGWMTRDEPFTHQLGRFADECNPWLLRWFPELAEVNQTLNALDDKMKLYGAEKGIQFWVANLHIVIEGLREEYDVGRIPQDDHEKKDPYDELVTMRGTDEGIIIAKDGEILP
jgi:hypothetical protein